MSTVSHITALVPTVRRRLLDADEVLREARRKIYHLRRRVRIEVSRLLEGLTSELHKLPQLSLVRPAIIALHNLSVSLAHDAEAEILMREIDTARECIASLLVDETLGWTNEELRNRARAALDDLGPPAMPCGHRASTLEICSVTTRPFPCDPSMAAEARPVALCTCSSCGQMATYDLGVLGVFGRRH